MPEEAFINLAPGRWSTVQIGADARVRLRGGVYEALDFTVEAGAQLEALNPVVLRVGRKLTFKNDTIIKPIVTYQSRDIRIEVLGDNGATAQPELATQGAFLEESALVYGMLLAPRATVRLAPQAHLRGAVVARDFIAQADSGFAYTHGLGIDGSGCVSACDDDNPCTLDVCMQAATVCEHLAIGNGGNCSAPTDDATCDGIDDDNDGNVDEDYVASCIGAAAQRCINGSVQSVACADGNACNGAESCTGTGSCVAGTPPALDDGNPCTADACDPLTGVTHVAVAAGTSCGDGDACNGAETCDGAGACGAGTPPALEDGNPCTADACDPSAGVVHVAVAAGTPCTDGNACNGAETCNAVGACTAGLAPVVDDGNPCTVDACDPVAGATHTPRPVGVDCGDANVCNGAETCTVAAECVASGPPVIDDGNPCSVDRCDAALGVLHEPALPGTSCANANICDGNEVCGASANCLAGTPVPVNDSNPCTSDACDPIAGVIHTPAPAGTSCSDGNACNGTESCGASGTCAPGVVPVLDDGNPCTADACDAAVGVTHVPLMAGSACSDSNYCNGDEACDSAGACAAGTPPNVDDGNRCTVDTCTPETLIVHTPIPGCDPSIDGDDRFETRASVLGRVVRRDGTGIPSFTVTVFDETTQNPPRADVQYQVSADGAFRARLTTFPETAPAGTPPIKIMVRIEGADFPALTRVTHVRPGDAADLGNLVVLQRDPQVTTIGPEGGTAEDSQGTIQLVIPPGALPSPAPIRITPIPTREEFPVPLPDATLTTYGMELEPSGLEFTVPVTLRQANHLNVPTTLQIPVGTIDERYGDWKHEGIATWDGQRFSTQIRHFSPYDLNPGTIGELRVTLVGGSDPNRSRDARCVGSEVGLLSGALRQSFALPSYRAVGREYGLSVHYDSGLSGSLTVGAPAGGGPPSGGFSTILVAPSLQIACVPVGAAGGGGGGCGSGSPCALGGIMAPSPVQRRVSMLGTETEDEGQLPAGGRAYGNAISVRVPNADDGRPIRSGYQRVTDTVTITPMNAAGSAAQMCAGGGMGFGYAAARDGGNQQRVSLGSPPVVTITTYELLTHRRNSPLGSGWALEQFGTLYRTPDRQMADLLHGDGRRETFRYYPLARQTANFGNSGGGAMATDLRTGEVFTARAFGFAGIHRLEVATGALTAVLPGSAFSGNTPYGLSVAYVGDERRFIVHAGFSLIELSATEPPRTLITFDSADPQFRPQPTASGRFVFFTRDDRFNTSGYSRSVFRIDLTDPSRTPEAISAGQEGELSLDPHGEVVAGDFLFARPRGLAPAPGGGLYVADSGRQAILHLAPNPSGEVDADSPVTRLAGSGAVSFMAGLGRATAALEATLPNPRALYPAQDGTLYIVLEGGALAAYDAAEKTVRWFAFDNTLAPFKNLEISLSEGSLAPLGAHRVLGIYSGHAFLVESKLTSELDGTRSLVFTAEGATLADTSQGVVEDYLWNDSTQSEARLRRVALRSGEPVLTIHYDDPDHIQSIDDAAGGRTTFEYNAGQLRAIRDPAGRRTEFEVNAAGTLREIRYASGERRTFEYEDFRMTAAIHPNGARTQYTYRDDGSLESARRPGGAVSVIEPALQSELPPEYDASGQRVHTVTFTDDHGVEHTLKLNRAGTTLSDSYVADGQSYTIENVLAAALAGDYGEGRPNEMQRIAATRVNGLQVTPMSSFDPLGRLVRRDEAARRGTSFSQGMIFSLAYDGAGRLSYFDTAVTSVDWRFTYDSAGHLSKVADIFAYNQAETGRRTELGTFRADGQPTTVTQRGVTTTFTYDARGRVTDAMNTLGETLHQEYDDAGNVSLRDDGASLFLYGYDAGNRLTSVTDADGYVTQLGYTDPGCACSNGDRVRSIVTPDLSPGQQWVLDYNPDGQLESVTTPQGETESYGYNTRRELTTFTDRKQRTSTFTYDQLGRPATVADPGGRVGTFAYPIPTSGGFTGSALYAASASVTPAPTSISADLSEGQYQIGLTLVSPATPPEVEFYRDATFEISYHRSWDLLGRLSYRKDRSELPVASPTPNTNNSPFLEENTTYDNFGSFLPLLRNLETYSPGRYYPAVVKRNSDFDIVELEDGIQPSLGHRQTLSRGVGGRLESSHTVVVGSVNAGGVSYTYTPSGQVHTVSDFLGNRGHTQVFTYNARGLIAERSLTFAPNSGPLTSHNVGTFQYVGYDELGRNTRLIYPDGHERIQTYDELGRLLSRCYRYGTVAPERCYTAQYDATGNPTVLTDPEGRTAVEYDELDRVRVVRRYRPASANTPSRVETYDYNPLGGFAVYDGVSRDDQRPRRSGVGTASAGVPATLAGTPLVLDGAGRITGFKEKSLAYYKARHLLQSVTVGSSETALGYDSLLRRTSHTSRTIGSTMDPSTLHFVYAGLDQNVSNTFSWQYDREDTDQDGNRSEIISSRQDSFVYDGIDHPLWMHSGYRWITAYFELDTLGNVRRIRGGQSLGSNPFDVPPSDFGGYEYTAFGKLVPESESGVPLPHYRLQPSDNDNDFDQPLRWQGRLTFGGDFYDFRARVWSPELGSFLQPDEFGYVTPTGTLWSWPGQNPYRWRDPTGRMIHMPQQTQDDLQLYSAASAWLFQNAASQFNSGAYASAALDFAAGIATGIAWFSAIPNPFGGAGVVFGPAGAGAQVGACAAKALPAGSFNVPSWAGYPSWAPNPAGPLRLLSGAEYDAARKAANAANAALRRADPAKYAGKQIHEIHPVKFGGSPTDPANKIALTPGEHSQLTNFWNQLMRDLQ
ncbi:MAG TPA: hypothetical protein VI072_15910 [Polyangiaceae bacterium]